MMIMKSISYKLVNRQTYVVESEGSARDMRKLRKLDPGKYEVYLSTNRPAIGQSLNHLEPSETGAM